MSTGTTEASPPDLSIAGRAADGIASVDGAVELTARPNLLIVASALDELAERGLDDFDALARTDEGTQIKKNWLREVRRLPPLRPGGDALFVKRYRSPGWKVLWRRGLWQDVRGGLREWRNLWRVHRLGVPTIEPMALGEGTFEGEPLYILVTRGLPSERTLEEELVDGMVYPPDAANRERKRALIEQLADRVRQLHDAGWFHRDLYLGHWMVDVEDNDKLYLCDVQRMGPARFSSWRLQNKEMAQLYYSALPPFVSEVDRMRFYRRYTGRTEPTRADRRRLTHIHWRVWRTRTHQARKRMRRITRENRSYGMFHDRLERRLEWSLDPRVPPTLLLAGGEPATARLVVDDDGARWQGDGWTVEAPAAPEALIGRELEGLLLTQRGQVKRWSIRDQEGLDPLTLWRWARDSDALEF